MEKRRLLTVDDEQSIRDLFRYLLEPHGFEIFTANDGIEAVDIVRNNDFDLIFLDVHMPRMRGPETLKIIKQLKPQQIVIIFSSSSDPKYIFEDEAEKHGAFTCIYKPFEVNEILKIIETVFNENIQSRV